MHEPRPIPGSLRRLGIEEVKERLELSTLAPATETFDSQAVENCCCCKINEPVPDDPFEDGRF